MVEEKSWAYFTHKADPILSLWLANFSKQSVVS